LNKGSALRSANAALALAIVLAATGDARGQAQVAAPTVTAGAAANIEGWIEGVVGTPVVGGKIAVGGWAGDRKKGAPVAKVEVFLDGKPEAVATINVTRADVAKVVGRLDYAQSGWNAVLNLDRVSPGAHTISAIASDAAGNKQALKGEKKIDVKPAAATGP